MANRKLGRTTDIRKSILKNLTTDLIMYGKITTTEARAKEVKSIADRNKQTELVKSKNGKEYLKVVKEETTESRQKDMPSRLNARRKIMNSINKVKDSEGNNIDLPSKMFNEIAPKYADRVGGYTRIVKAGTRKGDGAETAVLMLV